MICWRRTIINIDNIATSRIRGEPRVSTSTKRILIYSHDTVGLGNIRRALAIANHLVEANPYVTVLILTGSPMLHAFRLQPRIDYVKLPCLDRGNADEYRVKSLNVGFSDVLRLRANLIQQTITHFEPDLILVDKKPLGVERELAPAFEYLALKSVRPKCALILRDILDHPAQTMRIWNEHRYYDALSVFYDEIFVLGTEEVFDVATEYQFPKEVMDKVTYCGYLGRALGRRTPEQILQQFDNPSLPLVLVTVGGGADGLPILRCFIEGMEKQADQSRHNTLIMTGPEMACVERDTIVNKAAELDNCILSEFSNDIMSEMGAADLIVAMGGYNTVCEILTLQKNAIIIPRAEPVHEQIIRAKRMSKLGLFSMIDPAGLNPKSLMDAVKSSLAGTTLQKNRARRIELCGLPNLNKHLQKLLYPKQMEVNRQYFKAAIA